MDTLIHLVSIFLWTLLGVLFPLRFSLIFPQKVENIAVQIRFVLLYLLILPNPTRKTQTPSRREIC
jgi:hypothetical protein